MKLWPYLKNRMVQHGNQWITDETNELTYSQFVTRAESFAKKLISEPCCAILCSSELLTALALLSCFIAEVTAIPLSLRYGEKHCRKILDSMQPTAVITDNNGELEVICLSGSYLEPAHPAALIMCTSGTAGTPKGVVLSQQNILTNVKDIDAYFHLTANDTVLIARPLYHCAVLTGEFLVSLVNGARICFDSHPFHPHNIMRNISEQEVTVFCGTPTMFAMLMKSARGPWNHSLKKLCISGECLSKELGHQLSDFFADVDIYHVYGLTEACPRVSYLPPALFRKHPDSVGYPLRSVSLKIVTADGSLAAPDEYGILWIQGENVTEGYYNASKLTEKVLQDGWLCTGDIARQDKNGLLYIQGRADEMIIRAGMNIYPQEIEGALKQDYRVDEVLAYGYTHPISGKQIGLKISGRFNSINEVKQLCTERLPVFQIPTKIEIVDELQKNGSGKIVRKEKND